MKIMRAEKTKRKMEGEKVVISNKSNSLPLPAQRTPKIARQKKTVSSVTRDEIDKYWKLKKMNEEEHLLAALKAAARIKARALTDEDYRRFEESLRDAIKRANDADNNKELRVGIKDWWTKSKYAYLNEPPSTTKSVGEGAETKKATSTCIPQKKAYSYSLASSYYLVTSLGAF